jgi:hypothetical protein
MVPDPVIYLNPNSALMNLVLVIGLNDLDKKPLCSGKVELNTNHPNLRRRKNVIDGLLSLLKEENRGSQSTGKGIASFSLSNKIGQNIDK